MVIIVLSDLSLAARPLLSGLQVSWFRGRVVNPTGLATLEQLAASLVVAAGVAMSPGILWISTQQAAQLQSVWSHRSANQT